MAFSNIDQTKVPDQHQQNVFHQPVPTKIEANKPKPQSTNQTNPQQPVAKVAMTAS